LERAICPIAVALGTISFAICFAAWGLIGAFAPHFRDAFQLTASETALLVAVLVLLGSVARIPMGMLIDRFGGRAIFSILMAAESVAPWNPVRAAEVTGVAPEAIERAAH
jgi:NNP family nitrate/nitrite transporter-like MFS transporter